MEKGHFMKKKTDNWDFPKDENDRFILDMTIIDSSSFISPYCGNSPVIGSEVAAYLDNAIQNIPAKYDVSLHIKCHSISEDEQRIYRNAINNYYHNIVQQAIRNLFRNSIVSLIMALFGIAVIAIMLILTARGLNEVWDIVLEVIGWVFIWEAVDKFCFERYKLKHELRRAYQLKNADIKFINLDIDL